MADVCIECERLWKEYSTAMREYLAKGDRVGLRMSVPLLVTG